MSLRLVAPALASVWMLVGCQDDLVDGQSSAAPAPRACTLDTDCSTDRQEVCRAADGSGSPSAASGGTGWGICVIPSAAGAGEVFLEVRPLDASLPMTTFGPVKLADGQNQALTVPAPVKVEGIVAYHGTTPQTAVEHAKVRLRLDSPVPGRGHRYETTSDAAGSVLPGHFELLVPPGQYEVSVTPPRTDAGVMPPTERIYQASIDASELAASPNVFFVSSPDELVSFDGTAVFSRGGLPLPAAGLQVWALDADSVPAGASAVGRGGGRMLAQPVTTDGVGHFKLWLPRTEPPDNDGDENMTGHVVRLQFGPADPDAPFPTMLAKDEIRVGEGPTSASTIDVGTVEAPVKVQGRVLARTSSGGLGGVPFARVTFHTAERAAFAYSVTVLADATGAYEASLFPEVYAALAVAPPEGPIAQSICAGSGGAGELLATGPATYDFRCESRVTLFGLVRNHGTPVPGVAVDAVRRQDALVPDELHEQGATGDDGRFTLALARGTYDVTLTPPKGLKLPTKVLRGLVLGARAADGTVALRESVVVETDPPFELFGQLFAGDPNHPLAASIEAYAVTPAGKSLLVGRAVSQQDGSYSLVLPATTP